MCSPGRHLTNDATILELVAATLRANGNRVALATLDDAEAIRHEASLIFSMCQSPDGLRTIGDWECSGATVVNRSAASLSTYREALIPTLRRHGLPVPATTFVPTSPSARPDARRVLGNGGRWIKRGDLHASVPDDVRWVETGEALEQTLDDFERRGIAIAAVQAHAPGRELKFYAVRGIRLFPLSGRRRHSRRPERRRHGARAGRGHRHRARPRDFRRRHRHRTRPRPNPHRRQRLAVLRTLPRPGGGSDWRISGDAT